jgi:hypothetical protein
MADITISIPDEYWPRIATAFHGIYSNSESSDTELLAYAFTAYVRDNWITWEQYQNQEAVTTRYNQASADYNATRQSIDGDLASANAEVVADAAVAFPGF